MQFPEPGTQVRVNGEHVGVVVRLRSGEHVVVTPAFEIHEADIASLDPIQSQAGYSPALRVVDPYQNKDGVQ